MSNLATGIIPFTELVERAAKLAREDSLNVEPKFKGLINDVYTKHLPRQYDWRPLVRSSYITCTAYYNTGTASISAAGTSVTGVGTTWTTSMTSANGYKIKFAGNNNIYDFDYVSATTGTISPALSGASDLSAVSYKIFRDVYALASDFDRFLINGGLEFTRGSTPDIICETPEDMWKDEFQVEPQERLERIRTLGTSNASGYKQLQINPPPLTALMFPYDYIKLVTPLTEYTTGTITTLANGGTDITGSGTDFTGYIDSTLTNRYYFRIDGDGLGDSSVWYKIDEDNVANTTTNLVLADTYEGTAISSGTARFTISMVPELPSAFHDVILYRAVMLAIADQKDVLYKFYENLATTAVNELKTIHKTRTYNKRPDVSIDRR